MSTVRFIGCLHFGHTNMAKHRGFQDEYYHDEHLIEQFNSIVTKKTDLTYLLGDITMEKPDYYFQLDRLNGRKIVVLGNHDRYQNVRELLNYVETVGGMIEYKGFALTHCPIHPSEICFYRGNIHAHIHHVNELQDFLAYENYGDYNHDLLPTKQKYFNVDAKLIDFKPKTIDELLAERSPVEEIK